MNGIQQRLLLPLHYTSIQPCFEKKNWRKKEYTIEWHNNKWTARGEFTSKQHSMRNGFSSFGTISLTDRKQNSSMTKKNPTIFSFKFRSENKREGNQQNSESFSPYTTEYCFVMFALNGKAHSQTLTHSHKMAKQRDYYMTKRFSHFLFVDIFFFLVVQHMMLFNLCSFLFAHLNYISNDNNNIDAHHDGVDWSCRANMICESVDYYALTYIYGNMRVIIQCVFDSLSVPYV